MAPDDSPFLNALDRRRSDTAAIRAYGTAICGCISVSLLEGKSRFQTLFQTPGAPQDAPAECLSGATLLNSRPFNSH